SRQPPRRFDRHEDGVVFVAARRQNARDRQGGGAAGDLDRKVVSRAQTQGRGEPGPGERLERTRLRETFARPVTGDAPVRVEAARPGPEPRLPALDLPVEPGAAQEHGPAGGSARGRPEEPRRHVQDRCCGQDVVLPEILADGRQIRGVERSEEHTSELQSRSDLVCRLLLEKKKKKNKKKKKEKKKNIKNNRNKIKKK